jgi:hypothetical protein
MTVDVILRARLLAQPEVVAIVGARIFTTTFPVNGELPAVRITDISDQTTHHLRGGGGTWRKRVQIDAAAGPESGDPKGVARALAAAIRGDFAGGAPTGLLGFAGEVDGVALTGILLAAITETFEPDELQQVIVSTDYFVSGHGFLN